VDISICRITAHAKVPGWLDLSAMFIVPCFVTMEGCFSKRLYREGATAGEI